MSTSDPRGPRILVIEDEGIVARDIQQTLIDLGYQDVAIASSSDEALELAATLRPALVLMDIRIRGPVDGISTATLLRERHGVPVVYLTAHADLATFERAKLTAPLGYLMKPVQAAELRSTVELSIHRHQAEQRARSRQRWLETTLRSIGDAVVCLDDRQQVLFMNPAAEKLLGVDANGGVGLDATELLRQGAFAGDGVVVERVLLGDGGERVISERTATVRDGGDTLGQVMVLRDVTEQRRLDRRLEVADRLASLGTMAAGVAHEINNPLIAVTANLAVVRDRLDALVVPGVPIVEVLRNDLDELRDAIADSQMAAQRIARVVGDLKVFARPSEDRHTADVASCLDWAVRTTGHEVRQRARLVKQVARLPLVRGDETRLGQVFVALLINAAHAIDGGSVEQNLVQVVGEVVGDRVVIEIRDSGRGIPHALRSRIFEPFFTTKGLGEGTGLGLFICHSIVESVGGEIEVDSEVGRGATFRVRLPVAEPVPVEPVAEPVASRRGPAPPAVVSLHERRGRVLVVDDEPLVLRVVARILERDHEVVCVGSAHAALEALALRAFDVILCDLMMPRMNGIELHRQLTAAQPEQAARMVFLTGGAVTDEAERFLRTTRNRFLGKPISIERLQAAVLDMLQATAC